MSAAIGASTSPSSRLRPRAVLAMMRRDYLIRTSYRLSLVLDLFIGFLDLVVYYFISRTFEGASTAELQGAPSYFAFALVGIAVTVVIQAATTGVALRVREEQLTGTLEALLTQPVRSSELAMGLCGVPFVVATIRVAVYLFFAVALLGVGFSDADWLGFAVVLSCTGLAMSSIGIAAGAMVMVIKRGHSLAALIVFGMSLVGGAFFPVTVLPPILEKIGTVVPTRFAFDGLRAALYRGSGWEDEAFLLALFGVTSLPIALWLFTRALRWSRRTGGLAQY